MQEYALLCTTLQHAHVATLFKGKAVRSLLVCHYNDDSYLEKSLLSYDVIQNKVIMINVDSYLQRLIRLYSFPSANERDLLIVVLVRRQL